MAQTSRDHTHAKSIARDRADGGHPHAPTADHTSQPDHGHLSRRLTAVEWQLIMQFCSDARTLVALAQCSHATLAAASNPFAWRSLRPLRLGCAFPADLAAPSLLRHAELALEWRLPSSAAAHSTQISVAAMLPRLVSLTVTASTYRLGESGTVLLAAALGDQVEHGAALQSLSLRGQWIGRKGAVALAAFVRRSRTLTALDISDNFLDDEALTAVADAAARCATLCTLRLDCGSVWAVHMLRKALSQSRSRTQVEITIDVTAGNVATLVTALAQCPNSFQLRLRAASVTATDVEALATLLALQTECGSLTALHLSQPPASHFDVTPLAQALRDSRTLTELSLSGCHMADIHAVPLIRALRGDSDGVGLWLRSLDLSDSPITLGSIAELAAAMRDGLPLERLNLTACALHDEGMAVLAPGLSHCRTLRHLSLGFNSLTAAGLKALAAGIGPNVTALTSLDLRRNVVQDGGMEVLAPALAACRGLRHLDLSGCGLGHTSGATLSSLLQGSSIHSLLLGNNKIGDEGAVALTNVLDDDFALCRLVLGGNQIGSDGATAVAAAIARGWNLSELDLSCNPIGHVGAFELTTAFRPRVASLRLESLMLRDCGLTPDAAIILIKALRRSQRMRVLDLRGAADGSDSAAERLYAATRGTPLRPALLMHSAMEAALPRSGKQRSGSDSASGISGAALLIAAATVTLAGLFILTRLRLTRTV